jgi:EF-P beta-lysylation protein EpmB
MTSKRWQKSLKQALSGQQGDRLLRAVGYTPQAAELFKPVITGQMNQQIDWNNPHDPLLKQFLPLAEELRDDPAGLTDPVGDSAATQTTGLIHKYHGRVLLIASGSCAVNCRYCFRRHFAYHQQFAPRNNWQDSITYLRQHPDVHEVILSGGDPLTLGDEALQGLTDQLSDIDHIKTLRIHSRIPVVMPERIDDGFLSWAAGYELHKVMVLHTNHANELSPAAASAIQRLQQAGFALLNQSVLLKGVNDSADTLAELSHALFNHRVLPYYLHVFDPVANAGHFAVDEHSASRIHRQLAARLPGYLLPRLVQEIPGQPGKTPLRG